MSQDTRRQIALASEEPRAVTRLRELVRGKLPLEGLDLFEVQDAESVLEYIDQLRGAN